MCDQFSSCSVKKLVSCLNVFVCLELTTFGMYVKYYILQYVIIIRGMYVNYVEYMCMSCCFVCVEEGLNLERFLESTVGYFVTSSSLIKNCCFKTLVWYEKHFTMLARQVIQSSKSTKNLTMLPSYQNLPKFYNLLKSALIVTARTYTLTEHRMICSTFRSFISSVDCP